MSKTARRGAENARNQLPDPLEAAENGHSTLITKHGWAVAAIVPLDAYDAGRRPIRAHLALDGFGTDHSKVKSLRVIS